jgi:hypothetical protein
LDAVETAHLDLTVCLVQTDIKVCTIDPELIATMKKFRFRKEKTNAAVISAFLGLVCRATQLNLCRCFGTSRLAVKVDTKTMTVEVDEEMTDCSIEEVRVRVCVVVVERERCLFFCI